MVTGSDATSPPLSAGAVGSELGSLVCVPQADKTISRERQQARTANNLFFISHFLLES